MSGCDTVTKKRGNKLHFSPGKAISAAADEFDSDDTDDNGSEASAEGDSESEMEAIDDGDNTSEDDSGQLENFVPPTKGSITQSIRFCGCEIFCYRCIKI